VGLVAGNQYEVGDTFGELKFVGMPFIKKWKSWIPDLYHVLVLGTDPLFHPGKWVSKLAYDGHARDYGK
jgi:hypothetical protein